MYYLKLADTIVLEFDFDKKHIHVVNSSLLPFSLRGMTVITNAESYYEVKERILGWFLYRFTSNTRSNFELLLESYSYTESDCFNILLKHKGVSMLDSYWVTNDNSEPFSNVNTRKLPLSHYYDIDKKVFVKGKGYSPEFTLHGSSFLFWADLDGILSLAKVHSMSELRAFNIARCFNTSLGIVSYEYCEINRSEFLFTPCFMLDYPNASFVEAEEVLAYYGVEAFKGLLLRHGFGDMFILDYVLGNSDRHTQNYGFIMDNSTGNILFPAPLYDWGSSFDFNKTKCGISPTLMGRGSYLELAKLGMKYTSMTLDIRKLYNFIKCAYGDRFIYESICSRVDELGIEVV